jgi:hypothetical protein
VRRGAVLTAQGAFFFALTIATLLVSVSMAGARLFRHWFFVMREYAPDAVRAARSDGARTGRAVAALWRSRVRRPALTGVESAELLDHPLRAEVLAMEELADDPLAPEGVSAQPGLGLGAGR